MVSNVIDLYEIHKKKTSIYMYKRIRPSSYSSFIGNTTSHGDNSMAILIKKKMSIYSIFDTFDCFITVNQRVLWQLIGSSSF